MPRRMSFRGSRASLSLVTLGGGILEWKKEVLHLCAQPLYGFLNFLFFLCVSNEPKCTNKTWKIARKKDRYLSSRFTFQTFSAYHSQFAFENFRAFYPKHSTSDIYIYMDVQPTYYIRISVFTLFRYRITMRPTFISKSSLHLTRGGKKERKEENKKEKLTLVRIDLPLYSRSFKTHITRVSLIELSREKI